METRIKEILEKNDKPIKSFRDFELTENDLNFISRELEKYPNVSFINWGENKTVLNKSNDLKKIIQIRLVSNLLSNKDNHLVIDLSDCSLDDDFLELLETEIEKNFSIGGIIWGEQNEQILKNNRSISNIEKHLSKNNAEYKRFPSDYIHCVMANHCRNGDEKMRNILEKDGWSIKEEMKEKSYAAILYENNSQKQLVLAFRGMKFEIKDLFVEESQLEGWFYEMMGSEVSYQTCNAFQHTRAAYDMSKDLNYNLSFTGYSLGAWLAEQSAFFCYQEFGSLDVRAVTFESPGSVEILEELGQSNVARFDLKAKDLDNLDVRTYLLAPNFINTCNKHIGKVYRLYETSTPERRIKIIDDFTVNSFINVFPVKKVREKLTKWYTDNVKSNFSKYIFYLNGLRSLLSDDLSWILDEFDSDKRIFKCEVREVMNWPHMEFKPKREHFDNLDFKIFEKLRDFIPFGQVIPNILIKAIDWAISGGIKLITKRYLSGIALFINLIAEIKKGNLNSSQCLKCFEYEEHIFEHPDNTLKIFEGEFELKYEAKYWVRKFDRFYEKISEVHNHVDHKLVEFYFDINQTYSNSRLLVQLNDLKKHFVITQKWNGQFDVGDIKSVEIEVDVIRERFIRLFNINKIYTQKEKNHIKSLNNQSQYNDITDYFDDEPLDIFIKTDDKSFSDIDRILKNNKYAYIYGESGYGKTTLARMYAYYRKKSDPKILVITIDSDSLTANLIFIINKLNGEVNQDLKKEEDLIKLAKERLKSINKQVLFIFDNVKHLDEIRKIYLNLTNHKFLITTKKENLFENYDREKKFGVKIKPFNENNCLEYLKLKGIDVKSKKEKESWIEIIKESTRGKMKISPRIFELAIKNFTKKAWDKGELIKYLIEKSYERYKILEKENKKSYEMLEHLAYLNGKYIDKDIIRKMFLNDLDFDKNLEHLLKTGYLKKNKLEEIYIMHEKEQMDIKDLNKIRNKKEKILKKLIYVLNSSLSIDKDEMKNETKDKVKRYLKHINNIKDERWENKEKESNLLELLIKATIINEEIIFDYENLKKLEKEILKIRLKTLPSNHPDIASSYSHIGLVYLGQANLEKALENLFKSLDILIKILPPDYDKIASLYTNIGNVYNKNGNLNKALEYYFKSLELMEKTLPSDHAIKASTYNNIGLVYFKKGLFEKALEYYVKSIKIMKKTQTSNHPTIASCYNNIGMIYSTQGKIEKALKYYLKSVKIRQKSQPSNHKDITQTYNNIGIIYSDQGDLEKALKYYLKSLEILKQTLPSNHPDIALSYNNIGNVYNKQNKLEKALKYYLKSLEIMEQRLPLNHPDIALSYNNIAIIYYKNGNLENALDYNLKSLEIRQETLPSNHLDIAQSCNNLGIIYSDQGDLEKALKYYLKSLDIMKQTLPSNHPDIASLYNNIGMVYSDQSNLEKAMEYFFISLEIRQKMLPSNHPDLASLYNNIGRIYSKQDNLEKALEHFFKSLDIMSKTQLSNHSNIVFSYNNIGTVYLMKNNLDKALEYFFKTLEIIKTVPPNHLDIALIYNNIGQVFFKQEKFEKALDYYMKSIEIMNKMLPANHPNLITLYNSIGMVYSNQSNFDKAFEFFFKSLKIRQETLPSNHPDIASSYYDIGMVYLVKGDLEKAMEYLSKRNT